MTKEDREGLQKTLSQCAKSGDKTAYVLCMLCAMFEDVLENTNKQLTRIATALEELDASDNLKFMVELYKPVEK